MTELFPMVKKNSFTTSDLVKNTLEKANCRGLQPRDGFRNGNTEGLQQYANHWLQSRTRKPD